ncbi:MAG: AAA family ATPase [Verrucomicrobiae bacterium]|nr:AAA family ATPase [Verrucomicrobiae bacterium]
MTEPKKESCALAELREIFDSGHALVYLCSAEERRISQLLRAAAASFFVSPVELWTWSLTGGLRREGDPPARLDLAAPGAALDFIAKHPEPAIFHLKDIHEALNHAPEIRRRLRDLDAEDSGPRKFTVISAPIRSIPEELARCLVYLELTTPDMAELTDFLRAEAEAVARGGGTADASEAVLLQLARAIQGLNLDEARHAIHRTVARSKRLDQESIPFLLREKQILINRVGLVDCVNNGTQLDHVGGLKGLKDWLIQRRELFLRRDQVAAEIVPKGVLMMGISGCGKSLSVKAIASCFELPLYRIDMIEIFSGRHGRPEAAFVRACRMLEQVAPAVVWFDEIEMAVNSKSSEAGSELGRMFAFFLTWMQERTRGLFVAATANRIDLLPAEMIRKGRFDEIFFVDLPLDGERIEIFKVHLKRRGFDPGAFNLERLKSYTQGWTGAEVEQCVVSAITSACLENRRIDSDDLLSAAAHIVPLSKTMREQVEHIRTWAFTRAVRASPVDFRP